MLPRVMLRPGVHVVGRDDDHVQVGLDPPHRVIVRRGPECERLLDGLAAGDGVEPQDEPGRRLLRRLGEAGLLAPVPADDDTGSHGGAGAGGPTPGSVALMPGNLDLTRLRDLATRAGVRTSRTDDEATVAVLGAAGPLPREQGDRCVAEGRPHLVVCGTGVPGSLRLGPFVVPGETACLRCVDAHESDADPRRPLVLAQLSERPAVEVDPVTLALAAAWAARDLRTFLCGGEPSTWSATVDLGGPVPVRRRWRRHPYCGCGWDVDPLHA